MGRAETTIGLDIGGICVMVTSPHRQIIAHVRDRYGDFLSDKEPDFEIEMAFLGDTDPAEFLGVPREPLAEFIERNTLPHQRGPSPRQPGNRYHQPHPAGEPDGEPESGSKPKITHLDDHRVLLQRIDFAGCMDMKARRGRSTFGENTEVFAVESFLRICYSFLAVEHEGLLLHSAGVLRDGSGYIFPGQSGTGKSTIASLATDRETILSDEMVVVRKRAGDYTVYSTPFYGTNESMEQNTGGPLKAAFLPVKDDEVYLEETRPARALSKLLASVLFFGREPSLSQRLVDIATDLVAHVPFYEMHFRRDSSFWECIGELETTEVHV